MASNQKGPCLTQVSIPMYAMKALGSRHILMGGGGGAASTGVHNELQLYLLTYNHFAKIDGGRYQHLRGKKTATINTGLQPTMNMDVYPIGSPDSGRYFIAAGQGDSTVFYETTGFDLAPEETDLDSPSRLSLRFQDILKIKTTHGGDEKNKAYQSCIKFDRSATKPLKVATGGTDGYLRIWDALSICQNRDPTIQRKPMLEIMVDDSSKPDVNHVDFSFCGSVALTVCPSGVSLWQLSTQAKLGTLIETSDLPHAKYICRDARFVNLNPQSKRIFFIAAHNCRQRNSKQDCKLALWAFDQEQKKFSQLEMKIVDKNAISCVTVSNCSSMVAVGTLTGDVFVYDVRMLNLLYSSRSSHGLFVTSLEFLPRRTFDTPTMGRIEQSNGHQNAQTFLPGVTSESFVSVISLSVDNQAIVHSVPFPKGISTTKYWTKTAFWLLSFYFLLWAFLFY